MHEPAQNTPLRVIQSVQGIVVSGVGLIHRRLAQWRLPDCYPCAFRSAIDNYKRAGECLAARTLSLHLSGSSRYAVTYHAYMQYMATSVDLMIEGDN